MATWLLDGAVGWLAQRVQGMLSALVSVLGAAFFTSPDVTLFPQVRSLADRSAVVVGAAFALAVVVAGLTAMVHGTVQIRYEVKDLLPRLVFGFVMSAFGVPVCGVLIEVGNSLATAMVGDTSTGERSVEFVRARLVSAAADPESALLAVVIAAVIVVLFYLLLVSWLARLIGLIILAGVAPLALACYCLPQLQPAAQLWWRALLGMLATPVAQALCFTTGVRLLLDPDVNVAVLLTPAGSTDVVNRFIAAGVLWFTVKVPSLISRYALQGGSGRSSVGVVLRTLVVQSVTRRLPIRR